MPEEKYPEHEKMEAVKADSQTIGEFLEWLFSNGQELCVWRDEGNNGESFYIEHVIGENGICNRCGDDRHCRHVHFSVGTIVYEDGAGYCSPNINFPDRKKNAKHRSWGEGFVPINRNIEKTLAEYFEIDLNKINDEKRAMLESLRKAA